MSDVNCKEPINEKAIVLRELSVVIPAYNEKNRIRQTLVEIHEYLSKHCASYEIIVVDDGSSDNTISVVESIAESRPHIRLIRYDKNMGKGFAVRTGILETQYDMVLFSDADLATPIEEVEQLIKCSSPNHQVRIGSRAVKGANITIQQPWYRKIAGRTFNYILQLILIHGIKDTQCGFKLFDGNVARELFAACRENGFAFDIEVLHLALARGYNIAEVPVCWRHVDGSRVSLLSDSIKMFFTAIRIRLHSRG